MPKLRNILIASAAVLALTGFAGLAQAGSPPTHVLTVQLPDGGVARIHYSGDVPPAVMLAPMDTAFAPADGMWASPFAMLDRISAEMDRAAAELWQQAASAPFALPGDAGRTLQAGFAGLPANGGYCMRSVTITATADGAPPKIVSHVAGDCAPAGAASQPAVQPAVPLPDGQAHTIQVKGPAMPRPNAWRG